MKQVGNEKWGFIRENRDKAKSAGIDADTGLHRTGIEDYLVVIFPEIKEEEWIYNKGIPHSGLNRRPDYRCEKLKLIIEVDGLPHYQKPDVIRKDEDTTKKYEELGYKVVRIPYFIQLTNEVIYNMFDRIISEPMFNPDIPSIGIKGLNTPAYCCPAGIRRMAKELKKYPQQYKVNKDALRTANDEFLTGLNLLEKEYNVVTINVKQD